MKKSRLLSAIALSNILPFVYFMGGLGLTCNFNSSLCFHSGNVFTLLACLIWARRLESKQG
jgi:hypothetical protein